MKKILNTIKKYETIIIHRHIQPDYDAYGSQFGLAFTLKENFKDKKIYVVGEENNLSYLGKMDIIDDVVFKNALSIILDVSNKDRVSDQRFTLSKEIIVIDHHQNVCDIDCYNIIKPTYGACAELVAEFIYDSKLKMTKEAATMLFAGIISDTGRFMYTKNNPNPLLIAAKLLSDGADSHSIYDNLYNEPLEKKKQKAYFASKIQYTKNNVSYMFNDKDVFELYDITTFDVSRGMVNLMSGVKEVPIWCNFTYNIEKNNIMCEFRSKDIIIVDVARKYGGGGHNNACGATVESFDVCKNILDDFDKLLEENK